MGVQGLLRQPRQLLATFGIAAVLGYVYYWFDLREGGRAANMLTTKESTPDFYIQHFGGWYYWGAVTLDIALALVGAALIVITVANYRARRRATQCAVGTSGALGLAVATFACPGCPLPIAGTLGISFFANSLPLFGLEFKVLALAIALGSLLWFSGRLGRMDLVGRATAVARPA